MLCHCKNNTRLTTSVLNALCGHVALSYKKTKVVGKRVISGVANIAKPSPQMYLVPERDTGTVRQRPVGLTTGMSYA